MNAMKDSAHEAMVVDLRMSAGTYVALIQALTRDKTKLSMLSLARSVQECATPVSIPEDVAAGFTTCLPSID